MSTTPYQIRALGDSAVKNLIINGNMDFWQRGTSFTPSGGASYNNRLSDRWNFGKDTSGSSPTFTQVSDVPTQAQSGWQSQWSLKATVGASPSSFSSGDGGFISYRVEGYDYQAIHARKVRIQFWVKSTLTGTYGLTLVNSANLAGGSRAYNTSYVINSASTWEKKTLDIALDTSGTWNFDNTNGLNILWCLGGVGTALTSTTNTWATVTPVAEGVTGQAQLLTTANATFQITQVALIPGNFDSALSIPFQRCGRSIGHELQMCQRYYEKSYDLATAPGTITTTGRRLIQLAPSAISATQMAYSFPFMVPKRASSTTTVYAPSTGASGVYSALNSSNAVVGTDAVLTSGGSENTFFVTVNQSSGEFGLALHFTADAEL